MSEHRAENILNKYTTGDKNLAKAQLRRVNLRGVSLRGGSLQGSDLSYADLRETDLSGALLESPVIYGGSSQF